MTTDAKLITARQVRDLLGGCSDMFLWRRLNDPKSRFPRPIVIARRRFWRATEIASWIEAQSEKAAA